MTATPFRELPIIGQRADTDGVVIERADGSNGRMSLATLLTGLGVPGVAGTGMPVFSASVAYNTATHTLEGSATNYDDPLPLPSLIAVVLPSVSVFLPRHADPLTVGINTIEGPLLDVFGNPVAARQLSPGAIHVMLRGTTGYRLLAEIHPRPQDFPIVMAFGSIPAGEATPLPFSIVEAQLAAGVSSMGRTLNYPAGQLSEHFVWFGVPLDAPDLDARVQNLAGGLADAFTIARLAAYDGVMFNGMGMKLWWTHTGNRFEAGDTFRFSFVPY